MTWRLNWHAQLDPTYGRDTTSKEGDNTSCIPQIPVQSVWWAWRTALFPQSLLHPSYLYRLDTSQELCPTKSFTPKSSKSNGDIHTNQHKKKRPQTFEKCPLCKNKIEVVTLRAFMCACNNRNNCVEQHITTVMITHHLPGSVSCLYLPYLYNVNQHICQPNAKVQEPLLENNKFQCPRLWHPYLRRHSICCLQRGHTPVIAAKGRNLLPTSCENNPFVKTRTFYSASHNHLLLQFITTCSRSVLEF